MPRRELVVWRERLGGREGLTGGPSPPMLHVSHGPLQRSVHETVNSLDAHGGIGDRSTVSRCGRRSLGGARS